MTFRTVRAIGLKMPGVVETTMYGKPAFKLRGKMIAVVASNTSAEPNTLAVLCDDPQLLIDDQPDVYYLKPHYEGYSVVLVRLARVTSDAMGDLLAGAYRLAGAQKPRRPAQRAETRASSMKRVPAMGLKRYAGTSRKPRRS